METVQNSTTTLYQRLGGEAKVRKIVSDIIDKNFNNPLISHHFQSVDLNNLKRLVFEFFSMGTGGPHAYTGRDMVSAHASMKISEEDFEASNADVMQALVENGVEASERNEIIAILNSMKGDVVRA